MKKLIEEWLIRKALLKRFLALDLTNQQQQIADISIAEKYYPAIRKSLIRGLLILPAILLLDNTLIAAVLIPITMVTGNAWFMVSIANIKKKFEKFGVELTASMFSGFVSSLIVLGLIAFSSLSAPVTSAWLAEISDNLIIQGLAALLGIWVVVGILFDVFSGALKYDINDAMLTGQAEYAEEYFKKSLSELNGIALFLRQEKQLGPANYLLGKTFQTFLRELEVVEAKIPPAQRKELTSGYMKLMEKPEMDQREADVLTLELLKVTLGLFKNIGKQKRNQWALKNIEHELRQIENKNEPQDVVDMRFATIFEEMAHLLGSQGSSLLD